MNEEMFNNLSSMLGNTETSSNFNDIFSSFTSNSNNSNNNSDNSSNFDFSNIDMATMMKIKKILGQLNTNKKDPRSNLLQSLKPYLRPSKQEKLDQYSKLLSLSSVLEAFNAVGGDNLK